MEVFLVILGLRWGPVGSQMRGVASLDVHVMGWSGKSDLGKNLGLLQHHLNHFLKVFGKMLLSWGCLIILKLCWSPVGLQIYGMASMDVNEMGWSRKLGLGKNLRLTLF